MMYQEENKRIVVRPARMGFFGKSMFMVVLLSCLWSLAATAAPGLGQIKLTPINPPPFCERAVAFRITYLLKAGHLSTIHHPSLETRKANADLILAKIVNTVIDREYLEKGKRIEDTFVSTPVTARYILSILGKSFFVSAPWKPENLTALGQYIKQADTTSFLQLSRMDVLLDSPPHAAAYMHYSNPVLLRLNGNGISDEVIVLFVNMSDR